EQRAWLPLWFEEIEGQAIVTASAHPQVKVGDRILAIDGKDPIATVTRLAESEGGSDLRRRSTAIFELSAGTPGEAAELIIEREGGAVAIAVQRTTELVPPKPT